MLRRLLDTGWEWTCRWCGHRNRGTATDSSLFCEKCGVSR